MTGGGRTVEMAGVQWTVEMARVQWPELNWLAGAGAGVIP